MPGLLLLVVVEVGVPVPVVPGFSEGFITQEVAETVSSPASKIVKILFFIVDCTSFHFLLLYCLTIYWTEACAPYNIPRIVYHNNIMLSMI